MKNSSRALLVLMVGMALPVPQNNGQALFVKAITLVADHVQDPKGVLQLAKNVDDRLAFMRSWDQILLNGASAFNPSTATLILAAVLTLFVVYWFNRFYDERVSPMERLLGKVAPIAGVFLTLVSPSAAITLGLVHTYFDFTAPTPVRLIPVPVAIR